jgi:hypothetical protein
VGGRRRPARGAAAGAAAPGGRRRKRWPLVGVALLAAGTALALWTLTTAGWRDPARLGAAGPASAVVAGGAAAVSPTAPPPPTAPSAAGSAGSADAVADLVVEVLAAYPHDPEAYTQGLV